VYSGAITVSSTMTVKAIAYESGITDSSVATATARRSVSAATSSCFVENPNFQKSSCFSRDAELDTRQSAAHTPSTARFGPPSLSIPRTLVCNIRLLAVSTAAFALASRPVAPAL
jgi:hypothetical protein